MYINTCIYVHVRMDVCIYICSFVPFFFNTCISERMNVMYVCMDV